jgi:ankyrin repeat protein
MHAVLAEGDDPVIVDLLLAGGASPSIADGHQKWTALHFAARDQKPRVTAALLNAGAAVDACDSFGNTPLWRCLTAGKVNTEVVKLLLARGADPDKKNAHGVSPRDVATRLRRNDILEILTG